MGSETRRPTRDIDLLSYGDHSVARYERIFREVCEQPVEDDGAVFHAETVRGDVITPGPVTAVYPSLLNLQAPELQMYTVESVVAEKFQALVALGLANSRMKDFYDLWILSRTFAFDGERLSAAVGATFSRRETPPPEAPPVGLTAQFVDDPARLGMWRAFLRRNKLGSAAGELREVVDDLRGFLMPVTEALREGKPFAMSWHTAGPWQPTAETDG